MHYIKTIPVFLAKGHHNAKVLVKNLTTNSDNLLDSGASESPIQPCLLLKICLEWATQNHFLRFPGCIHKGFIFFNVISQNETTISTERWLLSSSSHINSTLVPQPKQCYFPHLCLPFFPLLPTPWLLDLHVFWLHWQGSYYTFHERDKILLNSDLFSLVPNGRFLRGRIQYGYVVSESLQQQSDPPATLVYTWLLTTDISLLSTFGNHVLFCTLQSPEKVP